MMRFWLDLTATALPTHSEHSTSNTCRSDSAPSLTDKSANELHSYAVLFLLHFA